MRKFDLKLQAMPAACRFSFKGLFRINRLQPLFRGFWRPLCTPSRRIRSLHGLLFYMPPIPNPRTLWCPTVLGAIVAMVFAVAQACGNIRELKPHICIPPRLKRGRAFPKPAHTWSPNTAHAAQVRSLLFFPLRPVLTTPRCIYVELGLGFVGQRIGVAGVLGQTIAGLESWSSGFP